MDKILRFGHEWRLSGENWHAVVDGRYHALTWKFGQIHQAKVVVAYEHGKTRSTVCEGPAVGVCLRPGKTRDESMRRCLDWVESYKRDGAPTPGQVVEKCFRVFPDLFDTRAQVLEHIFFVGGCGYDWLDGALVETTADSEEEMAGFRKAWEAEEARWKEMGSRMEETVALLEKEGASDAVKEIREAQARAAGALEIRTAEEEQRLYTVSSEYCNIVCIPPDLRKDWRLTVIEALRMLERRGDEAAKALAAKKLEELGEE